MTAPAFPLRDAATMMRRDARHALRNPMMTLSSFLTPMSMLLLFVGVFGGAFEAALARSGGGSYIDYLTPGIVLMAVGSSVSATAVNINVDKSEGIFSRFRTMPIARTSVLAGAVVGSVVRTVLAAAGVLAVALALGFRSPASPGGWLVAMALVGVVALAMTWLGVALGLWAQSPAGANGASLLPQFLPFVSSAFVPTDSMPSGVAWFAEHQPYTPIIETLRSLLLTHGAGDQWLTTLGWCALIAVGGYAWSRWLYNRDPSAASRASVAQLMSR